MPDLRGNDIEVGDTVAAAIREGNVANLRIGTVVGTWYGPTPHVEQTDEVVAAQPDQVILVLWEYSDRNMVPRKPTSIGAKRVWRFDRV